MLLCCVPLQRLLESFLARLPAMGALVGGDLDRDSSDSDAGFDD